VGQFPPGLLQQIGGIGHQTLLINVRNTSSMVARLRWWCSHTLLVARLDDRTTGRWRCSRSLGAVRELVMFGIC
jgi:hypothetical protein